MPGRHRRTAEEHDAADAAAGVRVGERAVGERAAEPGDRARERLVADLDDVADGVPVVDPGETVEAPDRVGADVVAAVDVEQSVAAAVDHRQPTVLAGDEDAAGEEAVRRVGRPAAADRGSVIVLPTIVLDPPAEEWVEVAGLVAVVDVDEVADEEAAGGPVDAGERDAERGGADDPVADGDAWGRRARRRAPGCPCR